MAPLSASEVEHFLDSLRALARSGMPLPEGLRSFAAAGARTQRLKALCIALAEDTARGRTLSEALAARPDATPELVAVVRCSEHAGAAREVLDGALANARARRRLHHDLTLAMTYPLASCVVMMGVIQFIARIRGLPLWEAAQGEPGAFGMPSQVVAPLLEFLGTAPGIALSLVPAVATFLFIAHTRFRTAVLDAMCTVPGLGHLALLGDTAQFFSALGGFLRHGVPVPDALRAASVAIDGRALRTVALRMADAAERGKPLAEELPSWMPATARLLFSRGEAQGNLPDALEAGALSCREAYVRRGRAYSEIVNPLLFAIIGAIVLFILAGLYAPMAAMPVRLIQ